MKLTFRWYGVADRIPLGYIRQIPGISGVVTAIYNAKVGEVWSDTQLAQLAGMCAEHGLRMDVIESIPVHEDIKLGRPTRDRLIQNYCANIRAVASAGVKCICYNFMPVFDWLRTELAHQNPDGSTSLSYSRADYQRLDKTNLSLPGWDESYTSDQLSELLTAYAEVSHDQLRQNFIYFLNRVIPTCEECGVVMAVHPDDPPWDIFDLPRVVKNQADLDAIFDAVPSKANGLTLCSGSLGASKTNDLVSMASKYAGQGRVHFVHLRNILWTDDTDSFCETAHLSSCGSLDMAAIVKALVDAGFDGFVRPDHGRNIFGESGKPGYGLFDRALGAAYINGLFEMAERTKN